MPQTTPAMRAAPSKDEIVNLEKAYWDAMKAKDGARAAELSADPALVAGAQGVMTIPRGKMGQMTEAGDWTLESYAFDEVQVSTPAPDVAIIAYTVRQKVVMKGEPKELRAADTSTWVRGEDGWRCAAHTETFLQDGKGG